MRGTLKSLHAALHLYTANVSLLAKLGTMITALWMPCAVMDPKGELVQHLICLQSIMIIMSLLEPACESDVNIGKWHRLW